MTVVLCVVGMGFAVLSILSAGILEMLRLDSYWVKEGDQYYNHTYFQRIGAHSRLLVNFSVSYKISPPPSLLLISWCDDML